MERQNQPAWILRDLHKATFWDSWDSFPDFSARIYQPSFTSLVQVGDEPSGSAGPWDGQGSPVYPSEAAGPAGNSTWSCCTAEEGGDHSGVLEKWR